MNQTQALYRLILTYEWESGKSSSETYDEVETSEEVRGIIDAKIGMACRPAEYRENDNSRVIIMPPAMPFAHRQVDDSDEESDEECNTSPICRVFVNITRGDMAQSDFTVTAEELSQPHTITLPNLAGRIEQAIKRVLPSTAKVQ